MHNYTINASVQLLPIVNDKHPYVWVDQVVEAIRRSGIKYEVGPFATVLEGTYNEVISVVNALNEYLYEAHCSEWILNVQLQLRSNADVTGAEKTEKFKTNNN
ncbi:MAG TPA: thiamine-binding protein [Chitinophagaceae bacterium]|nr:thiamine-binding protein [Chitinophagaceae bacterium]